MDCFAGASTIRVTTMTANKATPSSSPRGMKLRNACTTIRAAWAKLDHAVKAIRLRFADGLRAASSKNAECDIKAKHHRQRRLLPDKHQQGINSSHKEQSHHDQYNLHRPFSTHAALLLNHLMGKRHTAYSLPRARNV